MAIEQPPLNVETSLKAYLVRVFQRVDMRLSNNGKLPVDNIIPKKPVVGKLYYFVDGVIGLEGVYVYKTTGWEYLG